MRRLGENLAVGTIRFWSDSLESVFDQYEMVMYYKEYDPLDCNRDGVIDRLDTYDLNRDGVWDISDLMLMIDAMFHQGAK